MQISDSERGESPECDSILQESGEVPEDMQAKPKFYKRDLLVVLREKHELKEELDTTREELAMAKT